MDINVISTQYISAIENEIKDELQIELSDWMRGAIEYHMGWVDQDFKPLQNAKAGKRLRPTICLLAYQGALESLQTGAGSEADLLRALPLAAAIEMIHNYTLVHDDIEDDDKLRHGRPTLWSIWGKPKAINVGDCLRTLAYRRLTRLRERNVKPELILELSDVLAATEIKLTLGQHADLSFEENPDVTTPMYLQMIEGKTAALVSSAVYTGALLALDPRDPSQQKQLSAFLRFGQQIGLGFQMKDDWLGIWGDSSQTGKSTSSDIQRRKKSLPIIYALDNAKPSQRDQLLELYRSTTPITDEQEKFVLAVLKQCEASDYVQEQANFYKQNAFDALLEAGRGEPFIQNNQALLQLSRLSTFLVERDR